MIFAGTYGPTINYGQSKLSELGLRQGGYEIDSCAFTYKRYAPERVGL